jgi:methyl-accepting chemotaxis protein
MKTINAKLIVSLVVGTILISIIVTYLLTSSFTSLANKQSKESLQMLSNSVFQTLRMSMNFGDGKIIEEARLEARKINGIHELKVHRSEKIIESFPSDKKYTKESAVLSVFNNKNEKLIESTDGKHMMRLLKPVIADKQCISCHYNVEEGYVLGVMDLTFDLTKIDNDILVSIEKMILFFVVAAVLSISMLILLLRKILFKRLSEFANAVQNLIRNSHGQEIDKLEVSSEDEVGKIGILFNQYIDVINDGMKKDIELIEEAKEVARQISAGDMTNKIHKDANNPAINDLKNIINNMLDSLKSKTHEISDVLKEYENDNYKAKINPSIQAIGIIKDLFERVDLLGQSLSKFSLDNMTNGIVLEKDSNHLSINVKRLTDAAKVQAESLHHTTESLDQITKDIDYNTEKAKTMSDLSNEVRDSVTKGHSLAKDTASAMDEINEATTKIYESIDSIDQIAFQTNILSLNAAVEAATAGEAGKGFAVVAGEVRNLANRSAEAAKVIKELVEQSQTKANEGKDKSDSMIKEYDILNNHVYHTIELIDDVSEASKKQDAGIKQINAAVHELENATHKSEEIAKKTNVIAVELVSLSQALVEQARSKEFDGKDGLVNSHKSTTGDLETF